MSIVCICVCRAVFPSIYAPSNIIVLCVFIDMKMNRVINIAVFSKAEP